MKKGGTKKFLGILNTGHFNFSYTEGGRVIKSYPNEIGKLCLQRCHLML